MKLLKLTEIDSNNDKNPFYINPTHIVVIMQDGDYTMLLTNHATLRVEEKASWIAEQVINY